MERSNLILTVKLLAGTDISVALGEMITLRHRLGVAIEADFNGIELFVCRDDQTIEGLVEKYHQDLRCSDPKKK